jgi:hypothetical protein
MAHKKKHTDPVPPGNRPSTGAASDRPDDAAPPAPEGAPFAEQDPKRRLGNYGGAGEHPYQQPGGRNDADH